MRNSSLAENRRKISGAVSRRRLLFSMTILMVLAVVLAGYHHGLAFNGYHLGGRTTRVRMDAFPRLSEKLIDRTTRPVTPVAIYGSAEFDAARVNPSSVSLSGAQPMLASTGNVRHKLKDVDRDGHKDLLVYFETKELKVANGEATLRLDGETYDRSWIQGSEQVRLTASEPVATAPQPQSDEPQTASTQVKPGVITPQTGQVFSNPAIISIPLVGTTGSTNGSASSPYPSNIVVTGVPAAASYRITVQLFDLRHHYPDDMDMLLVNPAGVKYIIMSDVGGDNSLSTCGATCDNGANPGTTGPTLTISDTATNTLPDASLLTTGAYKPADYTGGSDTFPIPAPAGPYNSPGSTDTPTMNSTLGVGDPNGIWSLYISDDQSGDSGRLNGGWALTIFTVSPTAAQPSLSGQITTSDGQPLAGTVLNLAGSQSARTITDSTGHYKFDNLSTDGFYTLTPQRAGYSFSPAELSFSLNASKTDAVFTASPNSNATANPLDTEMFFVRQQYVDFLGREPDQGGLSYWTSEIEKCGTDADCLHNRRIDVSAAFFAESEGQRGAAFIYRLYKAGLGRRLSYAEFSRDREQVIGGANLEQSRASFADSFVQREEFVDKYKQSPSADSFVDALLSNIRAESGVDLTSARSNLIEKYQSGSSQTESRSLVLREGAESGLFRQAEYNASFVLMEYFGYLRREPEEGGYRFWLEVMNETGGDYRGMVCSFITSAEYQERFSAYSSRTNAECGR